VNAGSVRAVGDSVRAVVLTTDAERLTASHEVRVEIATWARLDAEPVMQSVLLHEERISGCARCRRFGAAVMQDDTHALAAVADGTNLRLARVAFADGAVERWTVPLADASFDAPVGGVADGRGRALIVAGGALAEFEGSYEGPALGLRVDERGEPPVGIPGGRFDPPPQAGLFDDRSEFLRFRYGDDGVMGRLHRYRLESSGLREVDVFETQLGLAPDAMTTTSRAFVWVEPDPSLPGTATLHLLAQDMACTSEAPSQVASLPVPLVDADPRVVAATERDGRTFVLTLEIRGPEDHRATILDLGQCRAVPVP
jgi:hypothetical protein